MTLTAKQTRAWLLNFSNKIHDNKQYLSDLDQAIGDGDHGSNMSRGVTAVEAAITDESLEKASDVMKKAAMAMVSKVGGASGPLYGSAFLEMAKVIDNEAIARVIAAGLDGIKKRGKAEVEDKTMVDMWAPVVDALQDGRLSVEAIEEAKAQTKPLKAKKGRASYLNERSIGHLDPGAVSSSYLFIALLEEVEVND
ncbi:dihydroxyacetone kinase DhaL subunit [Streptohalobacillus salinus]|uniref:phosphoenolpyruvate--glycerone phosphotransferase n=1 Tax=Streptohalobacillus salinus TaxID=621096 RepID=A0A2V3WHM4_9BACI|nr:dihydroxyacetone kinase subunit DhaL [Streptohalobacillus salinus]PXW88309.1 dihydroxyacetone kinase DhaL subunit [Streptohalobacillus salinus]